MRKFATVLLVAAFATTAYGANLSMDFGPGTTGTVVGDTVTLGPTDFAEIQIWINGLTNGMAYFAFGMDIVPPLGEPPDFTFEGMAPGPLTGGYFYYANTFPQLVDGMAYPYIYGTQPPFLVATMLIHCTGVVSDHTIYTDDASGMGLAAFINQSTGVDYVGVNFDSAVHVVQIPEPASLALLALGGLALIRRR